MKIPFRKEDGYINATLLCKAGNKKFNDYSRLAQTIEFLESMILIAGIPAIKIIYMDT
jgi:hypothetical protein